MKTCRECYFYEKHPDLGRNGKGEEVETGWCYGAPPVFTPTGWGIPVVGAISRHCAAFREPTPVKKDKRK